MPTADDLQLWIAVPAIAVTIVFIGMFARPSERWWKTMFGTSLMLLAVAILIAETTVVLFRIYGPEYYGRDVLRVTAQCMTFVAMALRTWVLFSAQRHDRRSRPHSRH